MPSAAYQRWASSAIEALNQIEAAHRSVGGPRPGRRYATQQINHAYAVLLLSQFQRLCRDLHSECIDFFIPAGISQQWQSILRTNLKSGRKLDSGNPNPGNIGADFNRFGIAFWDEVRTLDPINQHHKDSLEMLSLWRNAIAHQDFSDPKLGKSNLQLRQVQSWRKACISLANAFDRVLFDRIQLVTGQVPW
jgi:hypothetical protein